MNWFLLAAAALAGVTTCAHFFAGGKGCLRPMLAADYDAVAKRTVHVCWHLVTLDLVMTTAVLTLAGLSPESAGWGGAAAVVSALNVGYGLIFFGFAATAPFPKALAALPQGFALVPMGALGLWGVFGGGL
jgi:hypothetical protein